MTVEAGLVCDSLVLEVLYYVELVFFQHIVIGVQFLVFLLKAGGLRFSLLPQTVVELELGCHLLELLFLIETGAFELVKLVDLRVNGFLQVADLE